MAAFSKKRIIYLVLTACLLAATTSVHAATGFPKIQMIVAGDGRGDCFLIELPDNTKMVVDIPDGYSSTLINKLNELHEQCSGAHEEPKNPQSELAPEGCGRHIARLEC